MDLPFSGFELTFIIIAFVVFSLFSLISVCIQPRADEPGNDIKDKWTKRFKRKKRVIIKQARQEP